MHSHRSSSRMDTRRFENDDNPGPPHATPEMERCAEACHEVSDVLLELIPHCLSIGEQHACPYHINLVLDTIAICQTAHNVMHRGSDHHAPICAACEDLCRACAEDCENIHPRDPHMLRAAEACWRCADMCGRMAHAGTRR